LLKNIEKLGSFCLHIGGIGDIFYTLSSCYDQNEEITVLSYANNPEVIKELLGGFKKITRKLVLQNSGNYAEMASTMTHAKFTGHLPPELKYGEWAKYNIFKDFKLTQTSWLADISAKKVKDFQVCIQPSGSGKGGHPEKHVCIEPQYWDSVTKALRKKGVKLCVLGLPEDLFNYSIEESENFTHLSLWEQMELIKGADLMIGADTWGKNLSLFAKIPTIVWKNNYVNEMRGFTEDPADPIFVYQWEEQKNLMIVEQDKKDTLNKFNGYLENIIK